MQQSQRRPRPSLTHAAHAASLASRASTPVKSQSKDNTPLHSLRESYDGVVMPRSPQKGQAGDAGVPARGHPGVPDRGGDDKEVGL